MAVERVVAVLMWHTKRWQLAATVMWCIVGLWMLDEVGGGGQQGVQLTWGNWFPGLLMLMLPMLLSSSNQLLLLLLLSYA